LLERLSSLSALSKQMEKSQLEELHR
jgi:hypothetical protein